MSAITWNSNNKINYEKLSKFSKEKRLWKKEKEEKQKSSEEKRKFVEFGVRKRNWRIEKNILFMSRIFSKKYPNLCKK